MESISVVDSLAGVDAAEWNALARRQPFVRHEFLSALIDTGCASARTGWAPRFLLARRAGALAGAMPLFAKSHSYGEYVFDWAWADAHERHGIEYYPKLVSAIPFTPVRGPRLLGSEKALLLDAALELARDASSLHVLFPAEEDLAHLLARGMLIRRTVQFHWRNHGYADFDDFLRRMTHARRKKIRQERRRVHGAGIGLSWIEGPSITRRHWEFFNRCYRKTYAEHRSSPYLSLEFFLRIGAGMPENLALLVADRQSGRPVPGEAEPGSDLPGRVEHRQERRLVVGQPDTQPDAAGSIDDLEVDFEPGADELLPAHVVEEVEELHTFVPVSVRGDDSRGETGNQVAGLYGNICPTGYADWGRMRAVFDAIRYVFAMS